MAKVASETAKKFEYDMDKCFECNHIFTNPMPREEALQYFYNSSYKDFENDFDLFILAYSTYYCPIIHK